MDSSPAAMSMRAPAAAMQVAAAPTASSSRSRDPRLLGSFDLPASWGYRRPMAFCKDLDALVSGSGNGPAATGEPRPESSSQSSPKGAAAQESPRQQCYLLRDRREGAGDAREHKKLWNMGRSGGSGGVFSVQLTKQEIDADFVAITGRKTPRRAKRQPKNVQRQINPLLPGNSLSEVSRDRYKVNEKGGF